MDYSIRDLEKITGIKTHTIRIWEQRYKLVEPKRTQTNIRYYSDEDLKYLINVALLNKTGYKISKIAKMDKSQLHETIHDVAHNESSEEYYINELIKCTIDMDEIQAEEIINTCIRNEGFQETIEKILFPFLERLGFLWHTSSINVAQEHMMSNIIRRKIIVATDRIIDNVNHRMKSVILFMPEWEGHELGLLFCNYRLRKKGHKVYYLGANMPTKDLVQMTKDVRVDSILGFITLNVSDRKMTHFLNQFNSIPNTQKYISCHKDNKLLRIADEVEHDISFVNTIILSFV